MDTSERSILNEPLDASDDSLVRSSSLPSIPTLLAVALLIPAAAAFSNQWLLEHNWLLGNRSNLSWHHYALYPWMALSAAAVSWTSGRYLYPALLRCIVFVWCLILLDLLTFMASLGSTHDSLFGYMLVSAQINLLILWTVLGSGGWQWRLPAMLAVAPLVILFCTSIGSGYWFSESWFSQTWKRVVLLTAIVAALLCAVLRSFGFSLRSYCDTGPNTEVQTLRISQFGVKHMLFWSAAIVPLLLIARSLDFLFIAKIKQNEFFPITLLAISLATVSLVAIWAVLGAGRWYVRLPFLILAPLLTTAALEGYSLSMGSQFTYLSFKRPVVDLYIEMSGSWFAWIWQGTALLAALLLFLRSSGYRLVRTTRVPSPRG